VKSQWLHLQNIYTLYTSGSQTLRVRGPLGTQCTLMDPHPSTCELSEYQFKTNSNKIIYLKFCNSFIMFAKFLIGPICYSVIFLPQSFTDRNVCVTIMDIRTQFRDQNICYVIIQNKQTLKNS
jgi:hypothetical protein